MLSDSEAKSLLHQLTLYAMSHGKDCHPHMSVGALADDLFDSLDFKATSDCDNHAYIKRYFQATEIGPNG